MEVGGAPNAEGAPRWLGKRPPFSGSLLESSWDQGQTIETAFVTFQLLPVGAGQKVKSESR